MQLWHRFTVIAVAVAALHGAALWALLGYRAQAKPMREAAPLLTRTVPAPVPSAQALIPTLLPTPSPAPKPPREPGARPAPAPRTAAAPAATASPVPASLPPAAMPLALNSSAPTPNAPTGSAVPAEAAAPITAPPTQAAAVPPKTAAPASQQPSTDADHADTQYRHPLPAISTRLGESGKVLVRVQVGTDGRALQVQLLKSSGFARLDDNALTTVARWRFKPGTRGGAPEVMWMEQPVNYTAQ